MEWFVETIWKYAISQSQRMKIITLTNQNTRWNLNISKLGKNKSSSWWQRWKKWCNRKQEFLLLRVIVALFSEIYFRAEMQMPNQIKQCKIIFESHIKTTAVKKLKVVFNSGSYNQNKWTLGFSMVLKS